MTLVEKLYDSALGALLIPDFVPLNLVSDIRADLACAPFARGPASYGRATQDLSILFMGPADEEPRFPSPPSICALQERYALLHTQLGATTVPNSCVAYRYDAGSAGLSSHVDQAYFVDVLAVFPVEGDADFYVCPTRHITHDDSCTNFGNVPGSLILLRAPRTSLENKLRPYHSVENVRTQRTSILIRTIRRTK